MNPRRTFFKKLLSVGLVSLVPSSFSSAKPSYNLVRNTKNEKDFWRSIRRQFPMDRGLTYFNSATMGPSPYMVLERIHKFHQQMNKSVSYKGSEEARKKLASFLSVEKSEISLTHNTTEGINTMAWGLPLKAGDEVIMTTQEHVGNALPWLNRAKLDHIKLKVFEPASTADEILSQVTSLIGPRTRAIAVPHINCTKGQVMPVQELSELGRKKGLFVCIDGAHGPGSTHLNLREMGCDFYASSCHKWMLGPNGTGFLYVKKELLDTLQAYHVGAYSDTGWTLTPQTQELAGYNPTAHRYDFGTQNAALYQGVVAAIEFLEEIGMEKVEKRVAELASYLQNRLLEYPDYIEMLTPTEDRSRAGIVSFRPKQTDYLGFNKRASSERIRVRIVPEAQLNAIRVSTHIFNSYEEIDQLLDLVSV